MKSPLTDAQIDEFWRWFNSVCANFGQQFENQHLIGQLDARISSLGNFAWELGPGAREPSNNALVFSPAGDPGLLEQTRRIVSRAPHCNGWEFYAAKPPKKWRRVFSLGDRGKEIHVDASCWRYVLLRFPDGDFDIIICAPNVSYLAPAVRETAGEVLLDGELGEERRIESIHRIEVVHSFSSDMAAKSSPIEVLASHLAQLTE